MLGSLNRGGTETLLLDVFNNIQSSNIKAICVYRHEGDLSEEFKNSGIKFICLKPKHKFDLSYLFKLRKLFKQEKIKVAHAQQPLDALYAHLSVWGLKTKLVQTIHGYDFNYSIIHRRLFKYIKNRVSINIFVSNAQKRHYHQRYTFRERKSSVVHNGISFEKFKNFIKNSIREEFNIPNNHLLIGSVGNFNHVRDQLTICRFLDLLYKRNVPFSFLFAGQKSQAEPQYWDNCIDYCIENGLSKNVHFLGSRKDVPNMLNQLDAFVYSSEHDTFGIAVIEAIYSGIPVFVNDWEVMNEVTEAGKRGIVYKSKNENDLLEKFFQFIGERDSYLRQAKINSKWANVTYSIESYINNLSKLYGGLL